MEEQPGTGIGAYLFPDLYYHSLFNHNYSEIANYIDAINKAPVSEERKRNDIEKVYEIVRTSRVYKSNMLLVILSIITIFLIIVAIFARNPVIPLYGLAPLGFVFIQRKFFAEPMAARYVENFKRAHSAAHGKPTEMYDLIAQEKLDESDGVSHNQPPPRGQIGPISIGIV